MYVAYKNKELLPFIPLMFRILVIKFKLYTSVNILIQYCCMATAVHCIIILLLFFVFVLLLTRQFSREMGYGNS